MLRNTARPQYLCRIVSCQTSCQSHADIILPLVKYAKTPSHATYPINQVLAYFFLPLPFDFVAEPFEATLLAREVDADAGDALLLTASNCLF
jgi:hypothetical protein